MNRLYKQISIGLLLCAGISTALVGQTIAEKKAGVAYGGDLNFEMQKFLEDVNRELRDWERKLQLLHQQAMDLYQQGAPEEEFKKLLVEINSVRENIRILQESWREMASGANQSDEEGYALWHQPDTTIGQLVADYGSTSFVYLMSLDIGNLSLSVNSDLPIPRSSWNEMLELILNNNGIGVKTLNPYLKQLFLIDDDQSNLKLITNSRNELQALPADARVCFVLTPEPSDVRRIWFFLDKFMNHNSTVLQMIGRDILIIGQVAEVQSLLKIYDFVSQNRGDRDYKVIALQRVEAEEMAKILETIFNQFAEEASLETTAEPSGASAGSRAVKSQRIAGSSEGNGLRVVTLAGISQAIFLMGTKEEISKAEAIIREVEGQIGEARDKVIYTYSVKHSSAEELAEVLEKMYALMVQTGVGFEQAAEKQIRDYQQSQRLRAQGGNAELNNTTSNAANANIEAPPEQPSLVVTAQENFYLQGGYIVNPRPIWPEPLQKPEYNKDRSNFIIDAKTGTIVMVIEADIVPRMQELIRTLDVPVKMVQIEVLLFEKRLARENSYGLNLLRLGDAASQTKTAAATFNDVNHGKNPENLGVFEFFLSRPKSSGFPAYDLAYRFLLTQDDVQINANPSVITLNQTPAIISIQEEISVNTGIFQVPTANGVTLQDSFTRAQYGITIQVTPTIHMRESNNYYGQEPDYITLESDIVFDTIVPGSNPQRPDVVRRNIKNEARICDGETVILGGLRRKNTADSKEAIPFLGEIPGLGKLFSINSLQDNSTEMFIFITPKIISDPCEDLVQIRSREMCRRPGDIPAFMSRLVSAQECEKNRLFQGYMTMLFGRPPERLIPAPGEYDGRQQSRRNSCPR